MNRINRGAALDQVLVIDPSLLANVRYGFTNQEFPERRITQGYDLAGLGFSPGLTNMFDGRLATIPLVRLGGYSALSPWESGDGANTSLTHLGQANFTKLAGTHKWCYIPSLPIIPTHSPPAC